MERRKRYSLKVGGIVTDNTCALIQDLMTHGVTPGHIDTVIKMVANAFGIEVVGSVSLRTAGRVGIEGLIANDLLAVVGIQKVEGTV